MGKNRFVDPRTVRIDLSDGDWIEVKARLAYGEQQRMLGAVIGGVSLDDSAAGINLQNVPINLEKFSVARLSAWIVDWSFTRDGKRVEVTGDAIAALDPDTATEIDAALKAHIEAIEKN